MSAENFHTIKKISNSIQIYEPPPEFQDKFPTSHNNLITATATTTPSTVIRTTHIQSYASRLTQNIIKKAINTFHNLATKEIYYCEKHAAAKLKKQQQKKEMESEYLRSRSFVSNGYSIYGSDSFLNNYNKPSQLLTSGKSSNSNINIVESDEEDDIYDEPNAEYDIIYKDNKDTILCTKRIVRSLEKKKSDTRSHLYCNTDELFYEKLRSRGLSTAININNQHDDTNNNCSNSNHNNNRFQSNSFQKKFDKFLRSKFLNASNLTPTTTTSSIFYSFCHTGTSNVCNSSNPNSKNSLNSRLSSSHNSLTVPTNKADDSIFITQAMSHDQLGHNIEISDFYNVPLDSDIYTLPIDVINQQEEQHRQSSYRNHRAMSDNSLLCGGGSSGMKSHKFHRSKNKRSKRKKRTETSHDTVSCNRKLSNASSNVVTSHSFTVSHENRKVSTDKMKTKIIQATSNYSNDMGTKLRKNSDGTKAKGDTNNNNNNTSSNNSKYGSTAAVAKKSQFSISLNLKQKFCSIFRFKKSHQSSPTRNVNATHLQEEEKKVNLLSTRALPPLPGKGK